MPLRSSCLRLPTTLASDVLLAALRAAGEETRLRILALLSEGELSVSDMVAALQPDPREGDKGYTPSGRWVKIAQEDLKMLLIYFLL